MNREEILNTIEALAMSQGMYGRLFNNLKQMEVNDPEGYENAMDMLESKNFQNPVDLVMFIEG